MAAQNRNPFVGIAGVTGGISLAIVVIFALFARDQLAIAAWIVAALSGMGGLLGYFASRATTAR